MAHLRSAVVIGLVPALCAGLALAAPKDKKRPPPKKATPAKAEPPPKDDAGSDAATTTDDANATPKDPAGGGAGAGSGTASGGGAGSAAPAQVEPPKDDNKSAGDKKPEVDVDALRQEYLSLRDELFKSRARANAVASQLYSTRIQIKLTYTTARYYNPAKATIRLDGANVYENATGAIGGDDGIRFDGYVAPGKHLITFHVDATGKDDDSFTSSTETQIVVKAVANKDLVVAAKAKDGGDIAYEWKKSEHGSYGLGVDVSVTTKPRGEGAKK